MIAKAQYDVMLEMQFISAHAVPKNSETSGIRYVACAFEKTAAELTSVQTYEVCLGVFLLETDRSYNNLLCQNVSEITE